MNRIKLLALTVFLFMVAFCAAAFGQCPSAQQTTVSFTITDTDGQIWVGGQVTANLYNPSQTQKPLCASTNQTFPLTQTVTLDSSGHGSFVLTGNTAISPIGTRWIFTLQSQTSAVPSISTPQLIQTGGSQNLTTPLSAQAAGPRFQATPGSYGYRASETLPQPCQPANQWLDVLNGITYVCHGGSYITNSVELQTNGTDNHSQSLLNLKAGAGVTLTNPSGGEVDVVAAGGGGTPVNYLPSTTNFIFASYSGLYDDNHALSTAVPVADFTCTGTTCTVDTSTPHGLTTTGTDSYVDVTTMTGFGATQQTPGNGSFIVASTPTSTQFTFASSTVATCASSCGNIYDAGYWGLYQTAQQPFIKNSHGTVYGIESYASNLDTNFATLVAPMCALPGPNILLLFLGQNDIVSGGDSYLTVEGHLQSIWSKANAAGCQVVQATYTNVNAGFLTAAQYLAFSQLNAWIPQQSKSFANTASGQYWSKMIDYGSYIYDSHLMVLSDTNGAYQFAQRTNSAFATQSSSVTGPSPNFFWFSGQLGFNLFGAEGLYWFDNNQNAFLAFDPQQDSVTIQSNGGFSALVVTDKNSYVCDMTMGHDWDFYGATNNSMCFAFHYFGDGSTSNYMSFIPHNGASGDLIRFGADYSVTMPGFGGGGNQTLGVDNNGKFILGVGATAPAWTSASSGLASGNWSSSSCTVGGVAKTCIEEDIDTGALTNGATTTVPLISTITGGVFSVVCSDNSGRVQTGNTQPVGANFVGLSAPYATFFVWTGASGENAYCVVKGYN